MCVYNYAHIDMYVFFQSLLENQQKVFYLELSS